MKRIKLSKPDDLQQFKRHFEQHAGNAVSLEYLQASEVYAYRSGKALKAGYVIHSGRKHRFFDLMNEIGFDRIKPLPGRQEDFTEITCMWVEPDVRAYGFRVRFYADCMVSTFARRKRFIIGGTKAEAVARRQKHCLPNILFHGETDNTIGSGKWTIYYGTPATFMKGFINQFGEETRKFLRLGRGRSATVKAG